MPLVRTCTMCRLTAEVIMRKREGEYLVNTLVCASGHLSTESVWMPRTLPPPTVGREEVS